MKFGHDPFILIKDINILLYLYLLLLSLLGWHLTKCSIPLGFFALQNTVFLNRVYSKILFWEKFKKLFTLCHKIVKKLNCMDGTKTPR